MKIRSLVGLTGAETRWAGAANGLLDFALERHISQRNWR
jgi:hypothetical protein